MPKSAGVAGRSAAVAFVVCMTVVLLGGAFATDIVFRPDAATASTSGTPPTNPTSTEGFASSLVTSSSQTSSSWLSAASVTSSTTSTATSYKTTPTTSTTTTTTRTTTSSISSRTSTTSTTASSEPGTVEIVLPQGVGDNTTLNFTPSKVKVVVGVNGTIVWNDLDYVQHTVKSVSVPSGAKAWDSGILNEGQTYTLVLTVPGTYKYVCSIHPDWMVGTIEVVH